MKNEKTRMMTRSAVVAGLYVSLTMVNPIGYGVFQFRISEIICLLPFWWPEYRFACILGVISN